jgi:hypothetical protein
MKTKRILALLLAVGSLTVFTACEEALQSYANDYAYVNGKLQNSIGAIKDLGDILSGNANKTESSVGFVTEAEYKSAIEQALNATNSTSRVEIGYSFTDTPDSTNYVYNYLNADSSAYYYGTDENGEFKRYFATVDGVTYLYETDGSIWTKSVYTETVDYSNARYSLLLNAFKEVYSSLTYKEDETVFRATTLTLTNPEDETEKETLRDVTVKFVEKQFVSISFVADTLNADGEVIENVSCYLSIVDQGKTSVALPSVE